MVYGWLIAGAFTLFVALSMTEICSAYPTSGGLYFWSHKLAGTEWGPFASWITGWFNIVGQWAVTTIIQFSLAQLLQVIILLSTGGANGGGYYASKYVVIAMHGGLLVLSGVINSLPINWLSFMGTFTAFWNVLGVFVLMIVIPVVARERSTAEYVFKSFNNNNGEGIHSKPYIFFIGLLMSQYTLSGYDASAHMSEETKSSDKNGAYGILMAVIISIIAGWGYLLGITFAVTDIPYLLDPANDAKGYAVAQIFYDAFKSRYGSGTGGIVCLMIVAIAIFLYGMSSIMSNSRMAYAFSRDGAMPFSNLWHKVNKWEVPLNAVWLSVVISFCMALPVAFQAMVSIATIGLYIAYASPIFFRITLGREKFSPGPVNLAPFSLFIGWVAVLWVATITVLFCLPVAYPVTKESLNYAPVAVGEVLILVIGSWLLSARKWFTGPVTKLMAVIISIIAGWGYLLGITFAVTDILYLLDLANDAKGYAVAQIFYDAFKSRYGSGIGGIVCLMIVAIAIFLCGMSSIMSNSSMAYVFSRDGAMPFSNLWHKVNKWEVPLNAVWLSVVISFCMALPYLGSQVAFQAMVSIATIGLYIAYASPIFFRITLGREKFSPGPVNLAPFSLFIGWVAVLWVATITVLFCLPVAYPVTKESLNYVPVAVGEVLILVIGSWLLSARKWFTGPVTNIDEKTY